MNCAVPPTGGGPKRGSTKRGQFSSSHSCDDTLAEAVDDHYATVDVTQPVTPASPQVDSLSAQANDTPFLDTDAYSTVDYVSVWQGDLSQVT